MAENQTIYMLVPSSPFSLLLFYTFLCTGRGRSNQQAAFEGLKGPLKACLFDLFSCWNVFITISAQFTTESYALEAWKSACSLSLTSLQKTISTCCYEFVRIFLVLHVWMGGVWEDSAHPHASSHSLKVCSHSSTNCSFYVLGTFFLWAPSLSLSRKKDTDQFILLAGVFVCLVLPCRYLASWE